MSYIHEKRKKVDITIDKRLTNEFVGDIMNDVVSTLGYYNRSDKVQIWIPYTFNGES